MALSLVAAMIFQSVPLGLTVVVYASPARKARVSNLITTVNAPNAPNVRTSRRRRWTLTPTLRTRPSPATRRLHVGHKQHARATDATNVVFTDTIDPNTTFSGTAVSTPTRPSTTRSALGNVTQRDGQRRGEPAPNDNTPNTGNNQASRPRADDRPSNGQAASTPTASLATTRTRLHRSDSFTYTVTTTEGKPTRGPSTSRSAPRSLVHHNDPGAPAGNDGRITSPCNASSSYNASAPTKDPNDLIFIYTGAAAYTGRPDARQRHEGHRSGREPAGRGMRASAGSERSRAWAVRRPSTTPTRISITSPNTPCRLQYGNTGTTEATSPAPPRHAHRDALQYRRRRARAQPGDGHARRHHRQLSASNTGTNAGLTMNGVGGALTVSGPTTITTLAARARLPIRRRARTTTSARRPSTRAGGQRGHGRQPLANLGTPPSSALAVNTLFGIPLNTPAAARSTSPTRRAVALLRRSQAQGLVVSNTAVAMNSPPSAS